MSAVQATVAETTKKTPIKTRAVYVRVLSLAKSWGSYMLLAHNLTVKPRVGEGDDELACKKSKAHIYGKGKC